MNYWLDKIKRSKAMWLAFAVELVGVLQLVKDNIEELRVAIPPEYFGYFLIGVGVAIRIVRIFTTKALSDK